MSSDKIKDRDVEVFKSNIKFLKNRDNLKEDFVITKTIEIDSVDIEYKIIFIAAKRVVSITTENNLNLLPIYLDSFLEITPIVTSKLSDNDSVSILSLLLGSVDLEKEFSTIEEDLNNEKVEYINHNFRYYDIISNLTIESKNNIISSLVKLSTLQVPVVELGLGLRRNEYDLLNEYLILDTLDCQIDSQLINDSQAMQLLELQRLLEEYNVKENGVNDEVFNKIKYCIPAYFKVMIRTKQE